MICRKMVAGIISAATILATTGDQAWYGTRTDHIIYIKSTDMMDKDKLEN
jgi:hypothetical protein